MEDRTNDVAGVQEQSAEAKVQEQAVATAALTEAGQQALREEAAGTLKECSKAYRKGEKAYRAGLLEAGKLADAYIHQRMSLDDKRAAGVQAIEGELAKYSSTVVDVDRLIGVYHAYRMLALEPGIDDANVAYGHYREYKQLVQRIGKDTKEESWVLLPGVEGKCLELFSKATKDALGRDAVVEKIKGVLREYMAIRAEKTKQDAAEAKAKAADEAAKAATCTEETKGAIQAVEEADAAALVASPEQKAELTAAAQKAREELVSKQRQLLEQNTIAEEEDRIAARKETERKDAEAREAKAKEKKRKADEKAARKLVEDAAKDDQAPPPKPETGCQQTNLLAVAKAGTMETVTEMVVELITGVDDPDALLQRLLHVLKTHNCLSKQSRGACEAALVRLAPPSRMPVAKPQSTSPIAANAALEGAAITNGQVVTAA